MQIFIFRDGKSLGPYDLADLRALNVTGDTLVWYKGLAEWIPAKDAELTRSMFPAAEPAPQCPPAAEAPASAPEAPAQGPACPPVDPQPQCEPAQEPQPKVQQPVQEPAQSYSYQATYETEYTEERPNNYLWISIVCLCCCCMPAGIYSLIKAMDVNSAWALGDYERAENNSKQARLWGLIGMGAGALFWIIYIVFYIFVIAAQL